MKVLSIRAPWWWYILHGGKDIENRDWPSQYRGPLLIHASKYWSQMDIGDICCDLEQDGFPPPIHLDDLRGSGGHIVGVVSMTGCVERSDSPWFEGRYGFTLTDPQAFCAPIPLRGRLGLFDLPPALLPVVQQQIDGRAA